jgi:hypothetical protein
MKYITVYKWNLLDEIKQGATVYVLDKKEKEVICINEVLVDYAIRLFAEWEKDADRFEFWKEENENA